jgi:tetratricopeptide (TPR) repeat protein
MGFRDILRRWRERPAAARATPDAGVAAADATAAAELNQQGMLLRQRAQYAEAERSLMRAVELKHDFAEAHLNLGLTYLDQGHLEDAADCFQLAAHFAPGLVAAHIELGAVLVKLGRLDAAETAYRQALAINPDYGETWLRLADVLKARGDLDAAIDGYRAAVARDPALADAHCQLGYALYKAGRYNESRPCFDAALMLRPDFAEAHHNLGLLLLETGYPAEALRSFERALAIHPDAAEIRACVAHALRDLGRLDEALMHYEAALARQPGFADAVINRSYALLLREDYAAGWAEYERRFDIGAMPPRGFPFAPWRGEPLAGKRILVYAEQGLGDEIMFASCLPDLLRVAGHCVIECNTRLAKLFRRSFPRAHVHGAGKDDDQGWVTELPPLDCQVAIGSLPSYFRRSPTDFPPHRGYLAADAARVGHWRRELAAGSALRVGIAWRGGSLRSRQFTRSIALPQWLPLLRQRGAAFYALQYGDTAAELAQMHAQHGVSVRHLGNASDDLDELAAIISALDLVVSVDNTIAHLAGALGQTVWTLLPFSTEWRYPRSGEAMPWYPSARLFRQIQPLDWMPVMERAVHALQTDFAACSIA